MIGLLEGVRVVECAVPHHSPAHLLANRKRSSLTAPPGTRPREITPPGWSTRKGLIS
jgi:hypothetical protein